MAKCGDEFTSKDGDVSVSCDRDGRHVVHKDSTNGKSAVRVPGGALITERHGEGYVVQSAQRKR